MKVTVPAWSGDGATVAVSVTSVPPVVAFVVAVSVVVVAAAAFGV